MAIQSFASRVVEQFFREGRFPRGAGWGSVAKIAARKLDMLDYAAVLSDLASPPGNQLEALKRNLTDFTASGSTTSGGSSSAGRKPDLPRSTSSTTINGTPMRTMTHRRKPTSPGEILNEEFLKPLGMTQRKLADHLGCDIKVVNRIVNGRTSVSAEMALKLGAAFRTTPEFWLNAQKAVDLYRAARRLSDLPGPLLRKAEVPPFRLMTVGGEGPRPGIDLTKSR